MQLWSYAAIQLMDVRRVSMRYGESSGVYRFPTSGFVFATAGSALIRVDGKEQRVSRFHVIHGGKGTELTIRVLEDVFDYYFFLYKASLPTPINREIVRLMQQRDVFGQHYQFAPRYPAELYHRAVLMWQQWQEYGCTQQFQVKGLFMQFVHEIMLQWKQTDGQSNLDLTAQVIRYMRDHYREPLTRESLARIFHFSAPYLSNKFRKDTGSSLIDYLIGIRIEHAQVLLRHTDATIGETAESVGYEDVSYFARLFKKVTGVNPKAFKEQGASPMPDRPTYWNGSSIAPRKPWNHNEKDDDDQYEGEGYTSMFSNRASMGVTLLLCLTLLLGACANTSTTPLSGNTGGNSKNVVQHDTVGDSKPSTTITYKAVNGDIEIPKNPSRIVVVAGAYVGFLLALGIEPLAAGGEAFDNAYYDDRLAGVENIGHDVSLEKITALQPDLIIVWNSPDDIDNLSKIAATVAIDYGTPVREQLREFGEMTGREAEAEAWIKQWEEKIAQAKPLVQQAVGDRTISIFDSGSVKEFYAYGSFGRGGDIIYGEFGLKAPPIIQKEALDSGKGWAKLSLELLPEYAGDYIFISEWTENADSEAVFEGAIWDKLPAVEQGRVFRNAERGFVYSDPLSLEAQLVYVVERLTGR